MAKTSNLNIRVDDTVKKEAEEICAELGTSMSNAINMFLSSMVRHKGFPFDLRLDEIPNAETLEAIAEVQKMKNDPTLGKTYTNVDEMMKELLA